MDSNKIPFHIEVSGKEITGTLTPYTQDNLLSGLPTKFNIMLDVQDAQVFAGVIKFSEGKWQGDLEQPITDAIGEFIAEWYE